MGSQQVIVLDTHALVWWFTGARGLSARAKRTIQSAARQGSRVASAISVFEIATAVRRERLKFAVSLDQWLGDLRTLPELRLEPVTADIADLAGRPERSLPADPAGRIIVATAMTLQAKLVTADDRLRRLRQVDTVW